MSESLRGLVAPEADDSEGSWLKSSIPEAQPFWPCLTACLCARLLSGQRQLQAPAPVFLLMMLGLCLPAVRLQSLLDHLQTVSMS